MSKTTIEGKIEALKSLLSEYPDDLETIITYAEYQMRFGSRLEALQVYQNALSVNADNSEAHLGLSVIYMHHGLYEEGFSELIKILQFDYKNIDARIYYDYFASLHEPSKTITDEYNKLPSYDYSLQDLRVLEAHFDSLTELSDLHIAGYNELLEDADGSILYEYGREVALKRQEDIEGFKNHLVRIEGNILASIDDIKQSKREALEEKILDDEKLKMNEEADILEEERRKEEEERRRIEEERRAEEERRRREEEERRRREEEERRRREEEERIRREEEERIRREEEERLRIEEEERLRREEEERIRREEEERIRREEEERIRREEEARRAEEERIRLEEEARRAEEERIRREEEERRAEEERIRREEEERKAEEERKKREKYDNLRPALCEAMQSIGKHRGVNSVLLLEKGGVEIAAISPELDYSDYPNFTSEVVELIDSHYVDGAPSPLVYAVLEYKGGLIALRVVASKYLLAVIAGSSSNFGVLRYSMEKVSEKLCEMLD